MALGTLKSYYRNKRILRIRAVVENPRYVPIRTDGRNSVNHDTFSSHTYLWLGLTIAFLLMYAGLVTSLARAVPQPASILLYGMSALAAVESADWVWLRVYDDVEKFFFWVTVGVAVLIVAGLGLMVSNPTAAEVITGKVTRRFEAWRQEKSEAIQRGNETLVAFPTRGDDWALLTAPRAPGEVLLRAKFGEAEALCPNLGPGWRAPLAANELRDLHPHPQLPRPVYVWVGGMGSALEQSAERSGQVSVSGNAKSTHLVLCLRRDAP